MDQPSKKFSIFVIVLTICLTALLVFLVFAKFKTTDGAASEKPDSAINIETISPSKEDIANEKAFLQDAAWEDMKFVLSGVEYSLPLDVSELEDHGWTVHSEEIIEPDEKVSFEAYNGDASVNGYLTNPSDTNKDAKNCLIVEIGFSWANAVLPKNIEIMKSSIDDVYALYGEPLADDTENRSVTYETIDYSGGFEAFIDENRPGIAFFYDKEGLVVFAKLYCGKVTEGAK